MGLLAAVPAAAQDVMDVSMTGARIVCLFLFAIAAGCIGVQREPLPEAPQPGAAQEGATPVEPVVYPPPADGPAVRGAVTTDAQTGAVPVEPAVLPPQPPANGPAAPGAVKTEAPAAETPAKVPAPKEAAPKKESPAPIVKKATAPPPLDLASLEKGLKETAAIGVFTKLTLKNQVDDLLERFRDYYQGREKTSLAELRQPYDTLISKVLALLQDDDPALARALVASREAIWGILSDPVKFKAL